MIGEFPPVQFSLPASLECGFSRNEQRMLGHWMRDKNAADDQPARSRSAAPAAPPGAATQREACEDLYSRGDGRSGERSEQVSVRGRLASFLQHTMAAAGITRDNWPQAMPPGQHGWRTLLPFMP